ncbi:hypothetical protein J3R30DRAFT_3850302, partial [Lentinula aciculospora]
LNVLPWGHPALSEMNSKVSSKDGMKLGVPINVAVRERLSWFRDVIPHSVGVHLLSDGTWKDYDVDMVLWCNASKVRLGFCYAGNGFFYELSLEDGSPLVDIFFLELLAILSALDFVSHLQSPPEQVLIYSDNLDSVNTFNPIAVKNASHNAPLLTACGIILCSGVDPQVRHIPRKENVRADSLSWL